MENNKGKAGIVIHWIFTIVTLVLVILVSYMMTKLAKKEEVSNLQNQVQEMDQRIQKMENSVKPVENEKEPEDMYNVAKTAFKNMSKEYKENPSLYEVQTSSGSEMTLENLEKQFLAQDVVKETKSKGDWKISLDNNGTGILVTYTPKDSSQDEQVFALKVDVANTNNVFTVTKKEKNTNTTGTQNNQGNQTNSTNGNMTMQNQGQTGNMQTSGTMQNSQNTQNGNMQNNSQNSSSMSSTTPIELN